MPETRLEVRRWDGRKGISRFPPWGGYDDDYLASSISVYINCLSRLVFLTTSIINIVFSIIMIATMYLYMLYVIVSIPVHVISIAMYLSHGVVCPRLSFFMDAPLEGEDEGLANTARTTDWPTGLRRGVTTWSIFLIF